ncbi:MAG TPA: carbohydrate kinase family protein [Armatimonadota bacterium]|nr:carbohydrate kinase family protein [Armatimonadota bacterium]
MARGTADIVVAGHICLDMIPAFEAAETSLSDLLVPGKLVNVGPLTTATGGPVSNTGLALHRLGFQVRLMGKVGDDVAGRAIVELVSQLDAALAEGMILTTQSTSSYTVVISPPGVDRIFLHCPGANDTFGADDVDYGKLDDARLFHFGYPPLMRRMFIDGGGELSALLRRVKERGLTTSLDMARPDPASEAGRADWRTILSRALPYVDLFLPSFDETLFMLDRARFDQMDDEAEGGDLNSRASGRLLRELADELIEMGAAVVALKLGTQGLYLRTTKDPLRLASAGRCAPAQTEDWADRELLAPCFAVDVVGTTGSGDCTIAGFLGGVLKGLSPEEVMTAAVAVGACNVEKPDATSGIPHWSTVQERLRAGWGRRQVTCALHGWAWDEQEQIWRAG